MNLVTKGAPFTQGMVSNIPIGGSISPEGFLPSILLLVIVRIGETVRDEDLLGSLNNFTQDLLVFRGCDHMVLEKLSLHGPELGCLPESSKKAQGGDTGLGDERSMTVFFKVSVKKDE
ncbi:hypothetical protein Tco_0006910 [Tanacetum coccineum]